MQTLVQSRKHPSLRPSLPEYVQQSYAVAVKLASAETGLPASDFPTENPYSAEQVLDHDFMP